MTESSSSPELTKFSSYCNLYCHSRLVAQGQNSNNEAEVTGYLVCKREPASLIVCTRNPNCITDVCVSLVARFCLTLCNLMDCSPPGSSIHEFSRQEYWSGLPFPPQGNLFDPGTEPESPTSPALASRYFTTSTTWEAHITDKNVKKKKPAIYYNVSFRKKNLRI